MSLRLVTSVSTASGVSLPRWAWADWPSATSNLEPLEKNSGPPHSSVSTCATGVQMTEW
jgi:hypothetical protein